MRGKWTRSALDDGLSPDGTRLGPCRWQKAPIDERLDGGAERVAGLDRGIEAGLAKLHGAHKSHRARGSAKSKRKVGMLIALSDKRAQITARKTILGDNLRPDVGVVPNIGRNAGGLIRAHFHSERFRHCRPHAAPCEHVAVGDIEYLVRSLRDLCRPRHDLTDQVGVGRLPDERGPTRETERLALFPADRGVDTDGREYVQSALGRSGDELRPQHSVGEAVLSARVANVVLLVEEEVGMIVARVAFA